ncbi:hypothetical protein D1641_12555 [Colidextribacter sp. OB.20]|uniref:DUF6809 family protein n=1 Tax=Colidextribacter sp. OB.20 TaxID=2304568 RepID=UPI00136BCDAA|nr:DUF6809 family protein [Colidextribacter sp. OB.20]NBI10838.1 hypothetical protein [Colidextribacter sp. OB.20]
MDSLLYKLYSGEYDITVKQDEKLRKQLFTELNKVQRMFGDEFMERLMELGDERDDRQSFRCFQEGFSLGVRLMLEAFTPASATE